MDKNEVLYDHYRETVNQTKSEEVKRNKLFIIIILHILILLLITIHPQSIINTITELLYGNFNISLYFSINVVQLMIMFSMFYFLIRYYQVNIYIDRMYQYIHKIEEQVAENLKVGIRREGKNYVNNYPKTLDFIYVCYKYFFPILFSIILIVRMIINNTCNNWVVKVIEVIISIAMIVLNGLYIYDTLKQSK